MSQSVDVYTELMDVGAFLSQLLVTKTYRVSHPERALWCCYKLSIPRPAIWN